jgi:hypothetical protein
MIINQKKHCIIVKRDIKNVFRNVFIVVQLQWLLRFYWKEKYYKKRSLSFDLSSTLFLFNLFVEAIHWMIVFYLHWMNLQHYLNDFIEVFASDKFDFISFDQLMTVLEVLIKSVKNEKDTIISVFDIEVNINTFIARLSTDKLIKVIENTRLVSMTIIINLLEMQSLIEFLFFCARAIRLSHVFMRRLWDFVVFEFSRESRTIKRRISQWVRSDLLWWNKLLSKYNEVLFFDESNRDNNFLYTDACLTELREYYYKEMRVKSTINQSNAFVFALSSSSNSLSINVHEMKTILLAFQIFEKLWERTRLSVFIDNTTAYLELIKQILKESTNNSLREIFLLTVKWNIVIISHWILTKNNQLTNALSRFDWERIASMCSH